MNDVLRPLIRGLAQIEAIEAVAPDAWLTQATTYDLLARSARLFGARPAIVWLAQGNAGSAVEVITHHELFGRVTACANLLRASGVLPDEAVGLLLPPMPQAHVALWGAQAAARACPINFMLNAGHIAALLQAAGATALIALGPHAEFDIHAKLAQILPRTPGIRSVLLVGGSTGQEQPDTLHTGTGWPAHVRCLDLDAALRNTKADHLEFPRRPAAEDIAAYFHTGGTTGAPKLARHTHRNEVHTSWYAGGFYEFTPADVVMNGFPLFHVAGAFVYGLSTLAAGACLVLPTATGMRNRSFVQDYWRWCERLGVTVIAAVPTVLSALLEVPIAGADLRALRLALTGGSPLPNELAAAFEHTVGKPVRNILGMTECGGLISVMPLATPRVAGSCGLRLPYTQVRAFKVGAGGAPDFSRACASGETGVLCVRGPHVSPGYSDPARNAGTFTDDGWLISGDLGHVTADGQIHVTGRAKDVIIRGAHNIDPVMIEEVLSGHPDVALCAAIGEPDAYAGEVPVAYVTLRPGASADGAQILASCAPLIAERPAVPRRLTVLPAMPMTAIGKIYKPALRLLAIEQALTDALAGLPGAPRLPIKAEERDATLHATVEVWAARNTSLLKTIEARLGLFALQTRVVMHEED